MHRFLLILPSRVDKIFGRDTQQFRGFHATVAGNNLPLIVDQNRIAEAKFLDALGDLADLLMGVRPRVTRIRSGAIGGTQKNSREHFTSG